MTAPDPPTEGPASTDGITSIAPLVVSFDVGVPPERAFDVWVAQPVLWWPKGHTYSGGPAAITFEPRPGGRIFETDGAGVEHAWGEVVEWAPPSRLRYRWHLFFDRAEATEVCLTFTAIEGGTQVRLVQTGWDALGDAGRVRRERTIAGWAAVTAPYRDRLDHLRETP